MYLKKKYRIKECFVSQGFNEIWDGCNESDVNFLDSNEVFLDGGGFTSIL